MSESFWVRRSKEDWASFARLMYILWLCKVAKDDTLDDVKMKQWMSWMGCKRDT